MRKTKVGQDIIIGLNAAIAYERGEKKLRTSAIKIPDEPSQWSKKGIARLRKKRLNISQPKLALILGVAPKTVMAWEQGLKNPSGSARRLLDIIDISPGIVNQLPSSKRNETIYIDSVKHKHSMVKATQRIVRKKATKKAARSAGVRQKKSGS